jgi:hypothetical protein
MKTMRAHGSAESRGHVPPERPPLGSVLDLTLDSYTSHEHQLMLSDTTRLDWRLPPLVIEGPASAGLSLCEGDDASTGRAVQILWSSSCDCVTAGERRPIGGNQQRPRPKSGFGVRGIAHTFHAAPPAAVRSFLPKTARRGSNRSARAHSGGWLHWEQREAIAGTHRPI